LILVELFICVMYNKLWLEDSYLHFVQDLKP
jgi:hypothetical protein